MAKQGYYWIPQVDMTLNGQQYYEALVMGRPEFDMKKHLIRFRLSRYFPVGSILHFLKDNTEYVIKCRLKRPGLWYEAKRVDGGSIVPEDIERFTSKKPVYRCGFFHEKNK